MKNKWDKEVKERQRQERKKERKILPVTMLFCEKNSTSHMITVFWSCSNYSEQDSWVTNCKYFNIQCIKCMFMSPFCNRNLSHN